MLARCGWMARSLEMVYGDSLDRFPCRMARNEDGEWSSGVEELGGTASPCSTSLSLSLSLTFAPVATAPART